jgi:hypothetical protein
MYQRCFCRLGGVAHRTLTMKSQLNWHLVYASVGMQRAPAPCGVRCRKKTVRLRFNFYMPLLYDLHFTQVQGGEEKIRKKSDRNCLAIACVQRPNETGVYSIETMEFTDVKICAIRRNREVSETSLQLLSMVGWGEGKFSLGCSIRRAQLLSRKADIRKTTLPQQTAGR